MIGWRLLFILGLTLLAPLAGLVGEMALGMMADGFSTVWEFGAIGLGIGPPLGLLGALAAQFWLNNPQSLRKWTIRIWASALLCAVLFWFGLEPMPQRDNFPPGDPALSADRHPG